jgi:hypothetical protein
VSPCDKLGQAGLTLIEQRQPGRQRATSAHLTRPGLDDESPPTDATASRPPLPGAAQALVTVAEVLSHVRLETVGLAPAPPPKAEPRPSTYSPPTGDQPKQFSVSCFGRIGAVPVVGFLSLMGRILL